MPATITLKNIPDPIYARLKETAEAHHRSLNSEVIACLENALLPMQVSANERLTRARQLRSRLATTVFLATEIDEAIDQGRP